MTSVRREDVIPEVITDRTSSKRYLKGRFMGKVSIFSSYDLTTFHIIVIIIIIIIFIIINNLL